MYTILILIQLGNVEWAQLNQKEAEEWDKKVQKNKEHVEELKSEKKSRAEQHKGICADQ